ncbi:hypothetical protein ACP70R_043985 [Stipagrostis hirtigluma subsp. patula]
MSEKKNVSLAVADIYMFLKARHCSNLERLFVQLTHMYIPSYLHLEGSHDKWCCVDVELAVFLLKKASSLQKMLLVSTLDPPLNVPGVEEADLLLLKEAVESGQITLKDEESDDIATQPFHPEKEFDRV